jgi:murein DD-endopeptidase MepM/ murein hydrolase activator NlpD
LRALEEQHLAEEVWSVDSPDLLWQGDWTHPVTGTVSSRYGTQRSYNRDAAYARHLGVDFRARPGTPVFAPARGTVVVTETLEVFGNTVWLDHGWGMQSGYFHLEEVLVEPGQTVEPGDTIGTVGATGRVTGPHLHWEVRIHGVAVQPLEFLRRDVGALP